DDRPDPLPDAEALAPERQHLVVGREPRRLDELGARARLLVFDEAGIGDLAAAGRVEGRALELRLEEPVPELLEREDRGQHLRPRRRRSPRRASGRALASPRTAPPRSGRPPGSPARARAAPGTRGASARRRSR